MFRILRPACGLLLIFSVLTGLAYPLIVMEVGNAFFPFQAQGSLIEQSGRTVGSELIGQSFAAPENFWSRPSATTPMPYNGQSSAASNLGPLNPALVDAVRARLAALHQASPETRSRVPVDLVTSSASGLDPDLSPEAALFQVERVARARQLPVETVRALVLAEVRAPQWGFLGEPRVNVLRLNLALADLRGKP